MSYVLTERFCQDPLESYFGQQRAMGRRRDNPNVRTFGYQDNTIRLSKVFRPIAGNCRDEQEPSVFHSEKVPYRKNKQQKEGEINNTQNIYKPKNKLRQL